MIGELAISFLSLRMSANVISQVMTEGVGNAIVEVCRLDGEPSKREVFEGISPALLSRHKEVLEKHAGSPYSIIFDEGDGRYSKRGILIFMIKTHVGLDVLDVMRLPLDTKMEGDTFCAAVQKVLEESDLPPWMMVCNGVDNCNTMKKTLRLLRRKLDMDDLLEGMCVLHMMNLCSSRASAGCILLPSLRVDLRNLLFTRKMRASFLESGIHSLYMLRPTEVRWISMYLSVWFLLHNITPLVKWCVKTLKEDPKGQKKDIREKVVAISITLVNPGCIAEAQLVELLLIDGRDILCHQGLDMGPFFRERRAKLVANLEATSKRDAVKAKLSNSVAVMSGKMVDELPPKCDREVGVYYAKTAIDRFSSGIPKAIQVWKDHYYKSIDDCIALQELLKPTSFVHHLVDKCPFVDWTTVYPDDDPVRRIFSMNAKKLGILPNYEREWSMYVKKVKDLKDLLMAVAPGKDANEMDRATWEEMKVDCGDLHSLYTIVAAYSDNNSPVESSMSHLCVGEAPDRTRGGDEYFRNTVIASILPKSSFPLLDRPAKRVNKKHEHGRKRYPWVAGKQTAMLYPEQEVKELVELTKKEIKKYVEVDLDRAGRELEPVKRHVRLIPFMPGEDDELSGDEGAANEAVGGDGAEITSASASATTVVDDSDEEEDSDDEDDHALWAMEEAEGEEDEEELEGGEAIGQVKEILAHGLLDDGYISFHVVWKDGDDDWLDVRILRTWVSGRILIDKYLTELDEDDRNELEMYSDQWAVDRRRSAPVDDPER